MAKKKQLQKLERFDLPAGRILCSKYKVIERLGAGIEGEVYKVEELSAGVVRAMKLYFPHRNIKNKKATQYAQQLHKLSSCPILIKYHTQEQFWHHGHRVHGLVSEFVEGELLSGYISRQKGKKLDEHSALQLLHGLAQGLEHMHRLGEYHGDLHTENIIIKRYGLGFQFKLLDMYNWKDSKAANKTEDIVKSIRIFYNALGGRTNYSKMPQEIKQICLGMRRDLIVKKFKTAMQLRSYLENIEWGV